MCISIIREREKAGQPFRCHIHRIASQISITNVGYQMKYYVYLHRKADTGEIFYVGKGQGNRHSINKNRNKHWQNVANKHGYISEIIAFFDDEGEAFVVECEQIYYYRIIGIKLTNLTDGGEGTSGHSKSEESKAKMRGKNNPMFGKTHTLENKEKIKQGNLKENNPNFEKFGKMHQRYKGKIIATDIKTLKEYEFEGERALENAGFNAGNVYSILSGKRKSHKGFTFRRELL